MGSGVVAYWLEPNVLDAVLLAKLLSNLTPNQKLLKKPNWQPSLQPSYVVEIICDAALIAVGGTIIVVTLVEDASVVGIVDDVVTIPAGIMLINYGLRRAVVVPVQ